MSQTAGHCHQHPGKHSIELVAKCLLVYVFREIFFIFFFPLLLVVFLVFFRQMRSNPISTSVRLPQDPQASSTVTFQYNRLQTWVTSVLLGYFFHPHPPAQVTLYIGPVTFWLPWRNLGELMQERNKQTKKPTSIPMPVKISL